MSSLVQCVHITKYLNFVFCYHNFIKCSFHCFVLNKSRETVSTYLFKSGWDNLLFFSMRHCTFLANIWLIVCYFWLNDIMNYNLKTFRPGWINNRLKKIARQSHDRTKDEELDLRGRSQTTLTRFWLFLTTYPPALTFSTV